MPTIAIRIDANTLSLITVLNGGVEPSTASFGDYFVCDIEGKDVTSNHKIISYDKYRVMRSRNTVSLEMKLFQD